ncbi:Frigida-like [Arabidopsis thaliana x Arabidopsis arenosa]|uniref:FRIGIDA-like protein n=1 Tax=Arabidopsis thaliana x Arabidopsis arenosa TaxID=1240361 RepID=A0A8T2ANP1_9BRAS|nr:Frigida-like [Arabidopsis thaliana x Arabidopsis arenosa]
MDCCNKEEASSAKILAEEKMKAGDFVGAQKFVTKAQTLFPKVEPDQEIGAAKKRRKDDVEESSNKRTKQEDPFAEVDITEKYRILKELQKRVEKTMNEVRDAEKQRWKRIHDLNKNNMKNLPVKPDHIDTKAQELAILWKGKIRIETPRSSSSLELLAFLQFIVTFRLQNSIINQDETAQLASSVSHYKEAPTLFKSLGLDNLISFTSLRKEITDLRTKSQAEDKDWGKLRDILELMSDYNLKIEMPGDLIVKLMDQRPDNQPSTSNLAG